MQSFEEITQSHQAQQYLGYDPCIEHIGDHNLTDEKITVYLHGWEENKQSNLRRSLMTTPAVIFNFQDAKKDTITPLSHSSFGQYTDIEPTIFVLNAIIESGLAHRINLVGFSRGGATAVNTIAILNNPGRYGKKLEKIGVDSLRRKEILQAIERGIIVLDCPLKEVYYGILGHVKKYRSAFFAHTPGGSSSDNCTSWPLKIFNWSIDTLLTSFDFLCSIIAQYVFFPIYTHYSPWREEAMYTIHLWPIGRMTTIIRYDQCDSMISNHNDSSFYNTIHSLNPTRTFLVTSNNYGHCSNCQNLVNLFHILNEQSNYHLTTLQIIKQINQEGLIFI